MKVYIVETHYDFETHYIEGVYSDKEKAESVAKELEKDDSVLDGVAVYEYEVTR